MLLKGHVDVGHLLLQEFSLFPHLLCEQSLPGLVYTVIRDFFVIHQNDKSLDGRKDPIYVCRWCLASALGVGVISSNVFHTDHAVRFPLPANPDVVSHPVSA